MSELPGLSVAITAVVAIALWTGWERRERPVVAGDASPVLLPDMRIDLNTASASHLSALPGIGPALAGRIVEERDAQGSFASPADLQRVNGIGPGYIATAQTAPIRVGGHPFNDLVMTLTLADRWGEPEDVGNAALFLASKAADFINGTVLYVDGGITANFGYVKGEND